MFDFAPPTFIVPYRLTFADINSAYLRRLSERLVPFKHVRFATIEDDVDQSALQPGFDLVIGVVLLEHVDWRKAVGTIARLFSSRALVVTQENPERQASAMTPNREVPGTMNVFRESHPELISRPALQTEFRSLGFEVAYEAETIVADGSEDDRFGIRKTTEARLVRIIRQERSGPHGLPKLLATREPQRGIPHAANRSAARTHTQWVTQPEPEPTRESVSALLAPASAKP